MESVAALAIKVVEKQSLRERSFGQLELGQFDPGSEVELIEHALELLVGVTFGPFGDPVGRPARVGCRPSQTSFQEPQKLFAMVHASGALVGRISIPCSGLSPAMIGMA
jgi:hypothetical protein